MAESIVIISKQRLIGPTNGSSTYLLDIVRTLVDHGHKVHLIQPSPAVFGRMPFYRLSPAMDVFSSISIRGAVRFGSLVICVNAWPFRYLIPSVLRRAAAKLGMPGALGDDKAAPYSVAVPWRAADKAFLNGALPNGTYIAIADYIFVAAALEKLEPKPTKTAIVMHDLFHRRQPTTNEDTVAIVSEADEKRMLGLADAVLTIQSEETDWVSKNVPATEAVLVHMSTEISDQACPGNPDRLLFVGSNTGPNIEGLAWFLEEVWPKVLASAPNATLDVAGTVFRAFAGKNFSGVTFHGMVEDLEPLYRDAGVVISPLLYGSGLKIKLVEALARGKAMVVTPVTLQGVEDTVGPAVKTTDDPVKFAQAIQTLQDTEARTALAEKALATARQHFSRAVSHSGLVGWLGS